MAGTVDIKGVEILAAGTWQGITGGRQTYTLDDLHEMARAANAAEAAGVEAIKVTIGSVPVDVPVGNATIGHNDNGPDGRPRFEAPVIGRLSNVRVKGDRLIADIQGVPSRLARIIGTAYPHRSVEALRLRVRHGVEIGGERFRQMLTGLALLGESMPAVEGLADLPRVLAAGIEDDGDWITYAAADAVALEADPTPGAPSPTDLDAFVAALEGVFEKYAPLIYGRKGGPRARTLFSAFLSDVRASARPFLARGETSMEKVRVLEVLGLTCDAATADVVEAVRASTPEQAAALVRAAGPMEFASADSFVAWLAGMLGVGPSDLGAIAGAVASALGKDASAAPMGEPAAPEGGDMMQQAAAIAASDTVTVTKLSSDLAKLAGEHTAALARLAALEGAAAAATAEAMVEAEFARGKFLPPQRETLVRLAQHDPAAFRALADGQPVVVKLGERGFAGGDEGTVVEPSAAEIDVMERMGFSRDVARDMLMAQAKGDSA